MGRGVTDEGRNMNGAEDILGHISLGPAVHSESGSAPHQRRRWCHGGSAQLRFSPPRNAAAVHLLIGL